MSTVIADGITAHVENGRIILDEPTRWADGTRVVVGLPAEASTEDIRMDGNPWPKTSEEIQAWVREVSECPLVFESDDQREKFSDLLRESRDEQKRLERERLPKLEKLFR